MHDKCLNQNGRTQWNTEICFLLALPRYREYKLYSETVNQIFKFEDENLASFYLCRFNLVVTSLIKPLLAVEHSISAGLVHTPLRMYTQKALLLLRQKIKNTKLDPMSLPREPTDFMVFILKL